MKVTCLQHNYTQVTQICYFLFMNRQKLDSLLVVRQALQPREAKRLTFKPRLPDSGFDHLKHRFQMVLTHFRLLHLC